MATNDYLAAFWNLENLFDIQNSPRRSEKLQRTIRRELVGWGQGVFNKKVSQLANIIRAMNGGAGPDLIGLCEVENDYVLQQLVTKLGDLNRSYKIAHADSSDGRGIDVGFIYDSKLLIKKGLWSHYVVKRHATRDIVQVNFQTQSGKLLVAIGNHWPSRSGGQWSSEPYRIIAAETLAYFHDRIRQIHGSDVAVLAMGDFNDEPFDRSLIAYALSERTRSKVTRARSAKFLNLMWPALGQKIGTHYYQNVPNVLDQFLVSKGLLTGNAGLRIVPDSTEIFRPPEMVFTGAYPRPVRFGRGKTLDLDGYSDHFPITVRIRER